MFFCKKILVKYTYNLKIKKQYFFVCLLLSIFSTPIIVKSLHVHEHQLVCTAKYEKHFHNYHSKCDISNFVYSLYFSKNILNIDLLIKYIVYYKKLYNSIFYSKPYFLYISLRAPPKTIIHIK